MPQKSSHLTPNLTLRQQQRHHCFKCKQAKGSKVIIWCCAFGNFKLCSLTAVYLNLKSCIFSLKTETHTFHSELWPQIPILLTLTLQNHRPIWSQLGKKKNKMTFLWKGRRSKHQTRNRVNTTHRLSLFFSYDRMLNQL